MTKEEADEQLAKARGIFTQAMSNTFQRKEDEIKEEFFAFVKGEIQEELYEYEDYPMPDEALLQDVKVIISRIAENDEFFKIMEKYIRFIV